MFYHPNTHSIGIRDVAAAWVVCLAVAAAGFAGARAIADREDDAVAAHAPRWTAQAAAIAVCTVRTAPVAATRG